MPDNPFSGHCHEREFLQKIPVIAEGMNEPCLAILPECLGIDLENGIGIFGTFRPDKK